MSNRGIQLLNSKDILDMPDLTMSACNKNTCDRIYIKM